MYVIPPLNINNYFIVFVSDIDWFNSQYVFASSQVTPEWVNKEQDKCMSALLHELEVDFTRGQDDDGRWTLTSLAQLCHRSENNMSRVPSSLVTGRPTVTGWLHKQLGVHILFYW